MKSPYYYLVLFLLFTVNTIFAQKGQIKGKVVDASSNQPIAFATVSIVGTSQGTSTDFDGNYLLDKLAPGYYSISVSFLGYKTQSMAEVQVTNSKPAIIDFSLLEDVETISEVIVTASPFKKTEESPVSLQTIGTTEIQRNPGGNRDISKVIRVLPGVTTSNSFRNDLIIRGGAPNENRFYLDDVEVPNINHYATQGASGGPQGLINVDFIREVDFYSGAFPANRGNTLSSVFNFRQKNGRDDRLGFTTTLGSSDFALTLEGPLSKDKRTTFMASARQSYLQFLFDAIGLPFLPTYNDFQFKVRSLLKNNDEFYVTGLGALDRFKLNLDANETPEQRYALNNIPVNNQWNYALGAVYKKFAPKGYWTFVLSRNMLNNNIFKHLDNDESKVKTIDYLSQESENKFRAEHTVRFGKGFKLNYGLAYEYVRYYNKSKLFVLVNGNPLYNEYESTLLFSKYAAFAQLSKKFLSDRIVLSAGARLDGNSYSSEMSNPLKQASPRFSFSFALTDKLSLNANTGLYFQLPAYTSLGYRENGLLVNQDRLQYIQSFHNVLGLEYNFATATKVSIEGYYKIYKNYPFLLNQGISLANLGGDFGVVGAGPVDSRSEGRAYGLEFLFQQRIYKGFYGILAYTLGKVEFKDINNDFVPSTWDSRHIVNMALGKDFEIANQSIRKAKDAQREVEGKDPIGRKLIPQTLQLGLNFRMQTGLPYTPFNDSLSALTANWNAFGQGLRDYDRLNEVRADLFYGFDFRVDYKWYFEKWSLNLYFDLQNFPSQASQLPVLILDQGADGTQPVVVNNPGQPNESYQLKRINSTLSVSVPSIGIIVQY